MVERSAWRAIAMQYTYDIPIPRMFKTGGFYIACPTRLTPLIPFPPIFPPHAFGHFINHYFLHQPNPTSFFFLPSKYFIYYILIFSNSGWCWNLVCWCVHAIVVGRSFYARTDLNIGGVPCQILYRYRVPCQILYDTQIKP